MLYYWNRYVEMEVCKHIWEIDLVTLQILIVLIEQVNEFDLIVVLVNLEYDK